MLLGKGIQPKTLRNAKPSWGFYQQLLAFRTSWQSFWWHPGVWVPTHHMSLSSREGWGSGPQFLVVNIELGGGNSNIFGIFTLMWGRFPLWLIFFKWIETIYTYLETSETKLDHSTRGWKCGQLFSDVFVCWCFRATYRKPCTVHRNMNPIQCLNGRLLHFVWVNIGVIGTIFSIGQSNLRFQ